MAYADRAASFVRLFACAVLIVSGCSWIAQTHLDGDYEGGEPRCSTSKGFAVVDVILAVNDALGVALLAPNDSVEGSQKTASIVGGVAGTLLFAASAITGNGWANDCRSARDTWQAEAVEQQRFDEARARREMREELRRRSTASTPPPQPTAPRGFFCATSAAQPNAGFCTHEKGDCERARDAASAAIPDLRACTLVESAWCATDRCAPTKEVCDTLAQQSGSASADCVETR